MNEAENKLEEGEQEVSNLVCMSNLLPQVKTVTQEKKVVVIMPLTSSRGCVQGYRHRLSPIQGSFAFPAPSLSPCQALLVALTRFMCNVSR